MSDKAPSDSPKPVYVTQPFLPPLEELIPYLEQIWESKILTNGGPLHQQLEQALCEYLDVPYICLFNNGTIALLVALQALELSGEVITTPYTFVATTNAIHWNNLKPVFVDIDPETLNLDPQRIEAAITPRTSAILPVHCYGNPCDVDAIEAIARQHQLKVIYDAAHAFGVRCHCGSILNHGDLSVLSFHATKVFNTFEGGAIVCQTAEMKERIDRLKNFGFSGETELIEIGMNGKLSEVQAAMGLAQLKHLDKAVAARGQIDENYRQQLAGIAGIKVPGRAPQIQGNYSYFPILVGEEYRLSRDELQNLLKNHGFFARKYFYPLTSDLVAPHLPGNERVVEDTEIARGAAAKVLCLPMYSLLGSDKVEQLAAVIRRGS